MWLYWTRPDGNTRRIEEGQAISKTCHQCTAGDALRRFYRSHAHGREHEKAPRVEGLLIEND